MNKRGVFITFSVVIILFILAFMLTVSSRERRELGEINVQYQQHKNIADYITNMENLYLPSIIAISAKQSMMMISEHVNNTGSTVNITANLTYTMNHGRICVACPQLIRETVPNLINISFDTRSSSITFKNATYRIVSITQPDNWTLLINSSFNFTVENRIVTTNKKGNISWSKDLYYLTEMTVNNLVDVDSGMRISTTFWKENTSKECFLKSIDSDYNCNGIPGVSRP